MSNQVVILGSKIIPLVTPRSDVDIPGRQAGGKFYIKPAKVAAIRLVFLTSSTGSRIHISGLQALNGGVNKLLTSTAVASASSTFSGYPASAMINGSYATGWASSVNANVNRSNWWMAVFNTPQEIDAMQLLHGNLSYFPTKFDIEFKMEGQADFKVMATVQHAASGTWDPIYP